MLLFLRRHRRVLRQGAPLDAAASVESQGLKLPNADNEGRSNQRIMGVKAGALLAYGIPVMLGALAMPLIGLVDVFTVPRLLSSLGSEVEAMTQFGVYNRGLPLVQIVTMIATSLSVVFIPALAEAKYKGDMKLIENRCSLSLRWFWLLGLAASAGLAVLAEPINMALYGDTAGSSTMTCLALTAVGGTVSIISAALAGPRLRSRPGPAPFGRRAAQGGPEPAAGSAAGHYRRSHRWRGRAFVRSSAQRAAAVSPGPSAASPRRCPGTARAAHSGPGSCRCSHQLGRGRCGYGRWHRRRAHCQLGAEPARGARRLRCLCRRGYSPSAP